MEAVFAHMMVFVAYTAVYLFAFNKVEDRDVSVHLIDLPIDHMIPFIPIFIIPYLLWFAYMIYYLIFYLNRDLTEYYRLGSFLAAGMTVFILVSFIFPNGLNIRPGLASLNDTNFLNKLIKQLYLKDTSTNVFPSIHVYNTLGIISSYIYNKNKIIYSKAQKYIALILGGLIILSTMFIKQHSVVDVAGGFIMTFIFYHCFYNDKFTEFLVGMGFSGIPCKHEFVKLQKED